MAASGTQTRAGGNRTDMAPRIVPQASVTHRVPFALAILFAPFHLGYKLASTLFRGLMFLVSFLPRSIRPAAVTTAIAKSSYGRRQLMPRDAAARFKREFDEQYGSNELPFFEGGYAQAYDVAKKDVNFLLLMLISPEHDDTDSFVRETLLSSEVMSLIRDPANRIILWGGNVRDSEAYQVCNEYNCTKFPFSALICLTPKEGSTRMGTVKRLAGPMSPSAYVADIQAAIGKYGPDLEAVRAERSAQAVARNLRTEQDSAYERSLARDRERARQKKEAEAAAALAKKKAQEDAEAAEVLEKKRQLWRRWRAATMPAEPTTGAKDIVRLAVKLPEALGGSRIRRTFSSDTSMADLYAFVECYDILQDADSAIDEKVTEPEGYVHEYKFRIASLMPRVVYEPTETVSLAEKIGRSGNLIVEELREESDDEGED
jgi:FAS-associated factor 2